MSNYIEEPFKTVAIKGVIRKTIKVNINYCNVIQYRKKHKQNK